MRWSPKGTTAEFPSLCDVMEVPGPDELLMLYSSTSDPLPDAEPPEFSVILLLGEPKDGLEARCPSPAVLENFLASWRSLLAKNGETFSRRRFPQF